MSDRLAPGAPPAGDDSGGLDLGPRRRSPLRWLLRAALGFMVLGCLLFWGGARDVMRTVGSLDVRLWGAAAGLYLIGQALCAWKWGVLAAGLGMPRSYRALLAWYFGGMFANLFLPTTVGGDVGRALALGRRAGPSGRALLSVLADRGTGFAALLLLAGCAALVVPALPAWLRVGIVGGSALLLGLGAAVLMAPGRLGKTGGQMGAAIGALCRPRVLAPALGVSLVFQVIVWLVHLLLGRGVGITAPAGPYLLASTLAAVVAMAPISVNGIGTRDAAYVYLLGLAGVPRQEALAFSLAWLAMVAACSACGGLVCALLAPGDAGLLTRGARPVPTREEA